MNHHRPPYWLIPVFVMLIGAALEDAYDTELGIVYSGILVAIAIIMTCVFILKKAP